MLAEILVDHEGRRYSSAQVRARSWTFARFRPFAIELENGSRRRFDSLLFANITRMAEYATLSEGGPPDDGRFEVITLPTACGRVAAKSGTGKVEYWAEPGQ